MSHSPRPRVRSLSDVRTESSLRPISPACASEVRTIPALPQRKRLAALLLGRPARGERIDGYAPTMLNMIFDHPSPAGAAAALALVLALAMLALGLGAWLVVRIGNPD